MNCRCHSHNGLILERKLPLEDAQRDHEGPELAGVVAKRYLDSMGSVSGLELERDLYENIMDSDIDEQARRFLHGS